MTTNASRARIALERLEAEDPRGHALQLGAAMLWCLLSGIGTTPEAIAWALLLAVALIRLPKSLRTYRPSIRDPAWVLLGAWWLWNVLSLCWAVPGVDVAAGLEPLRWLLTPLLLWPIAGRATALLVCLGVGTLVQVCATLILSWGPDGLGRYTEMQGLTNFGNLSWDLTTALVLSCAALRYASWPGRIATLPMLAASAIAVAHAGYRFSIGVALAAAIALTLRPRGSLREGGRWVLPILLLAIGGGLMIQGDLIAWQRTRHQFGRFESSPDEEALMFMGSRRMGMAIASWDLIRDRPWLGGGRASYRPLMDGWAEERSSESPAQRRTFELVAEIEHPHNVYLISWIEGGVVSVVLVSGGLWTLAARLWRRSGREPVMAAALALYGAVLVGSFVSIIEFRTPGGLIALCLAISRNPCSMPRDEFDDA